MESLLALRGGVNRLKCGHSMHTNCLVKYLKNNFINCPVCKKSIYDKHVYERIMDYRIAHSRMPSEY